MQNPANILALRYASPEMREIWSAENKIIEERKLWVEILKVQKDLGVDISDDTVSAYEEVVEKVDLESIQRREEILRHDVMARIEEFSTLAKKQQIHLGLTSRDITENIEQRLIYLSLKLIYGQASIALQRLGELAKKHKSLRIVARTHNVPAQITTLGRRFAMLGEELLLPLKTLKDFLEQYKYRGIKGAVGTQSDMLELFQGDGEKAEELDRRIVKYLVDKSGEVEPTDDAAKPFISVGQIYPRSMDSVFANHLTNLISAPTNFALDLRLMAGQGLAGEGRTPDQAGSSAMPHKENPSLCERVSGLAILLKGYATMLSQLSGNQWNEGDVSCSVVRRVALPDICFVAEGVFRTFLNILDRLWVNAYAISDEVSRDLPFLASSRILIAATQSGMGREKAHEIIREKSQMAKEELDKLGNKSSSFPLKEHPLVKALTDSDNFLLGQEEILQAIQKEPLSGRAEAQVDEFLMESQKLAPKS